MTNRQSNIIFYSILSLIACALLINYINPSFFSDISKSTEERQIEQAKSTGQHSKALTIYQAQIDARVSTNKEITAETAMMYEEMAALYLALDNPTEEKNHYLKSLRIKEQLEDISISSITHTYDKLGSLLFAEKDYDQAQTYYEKSLAQKLGTTTQKENKGLVLGYQNDREQYLRLNNESTITTLQKLGDIHALKQESRLAKEYYERALAASKLTFEENDHRTLALEALVRQLSP